MNHILLTTDLSAGSLAGCEVAKKYAGMFGTSTRITVLYVLEDLVATSVQFEFGLALIDSKAVLEAAEREARTRLQELVTTNFAGMDVSAVLLRASHSIEKEISAYAVANAVDLIIAATHGSGGLHRLISGSVTERLLHEAPCSVLIVPSSMARGEASPFPIVLLTDFSEESVRAFEPAREIFEHYGPDLIHPILMHVAEQPRRHASAGAPAGTDPAYADARDESLARLEALRARFFRGLDVSLEVIPATGSVYAALTEYFERNAVGLVLMASHGHSLLEELFIGSLTTKLVRHAKQLMWVVPRERQTA